MSADVACMTGIFLIGCAIYLCPPLALVVGGCVFLALGVRQRILERKKVQHG